MNETLALCRERIEIKIYIYPFRHASIAYMELNHLKYFYEVARTGSFTEASRSLHVSQPSISKLVKLLEEEQGHKLFDRGKKGVTLTAAGKIFFASCQSIFGEIENLKATLLQQSEDCAGDLLVGASDNLCNYILPDLFSDLSAQYKRILVKLTSGSAQQIISELSSDQIEIGLFYTAVSDKRSFEVIKLWEVEFVAVCSSENKIMRDHGFNSRALDKMGYVGSRLADYGKPYAALQMLRTAGYSPQVVFETNSQETQKKMVLANLGYTVVPRHMVQTELQSGELRTIKMPRKMTADVFFVKRRSRSLSRPGLVFLEQLQSFKPENV